MNPSTIPSTRFSTRKFDVWRETVSVVFEVEPSPAGGAEKFGADFEAYQLGDMIVTDARLGRQRYIRRAAQARRDGVDHFVLNLYRTGGWKAQTPQGEFQGNAGQVSVLDLARDLISDEPRSSLVSLFVPRPLLEERLFDASALHGSAPTGPYAALLAEYLDLLARRLPTLPFGDEQSLGRATCEMVAACLQPSLAGMDGARSGLELVLRRRATHFIDTHLGSSDLSADTVCRALGVSRRTLYRLFDQERGVQHYIQSRRLERIQAALKDPNETRRISDIAAEFGFTRSDHFSRAFKQRFGQSARDIREAECQDVEVPIGDTSQQIAADEIFKHWIRELSV